MSEPKIIFDPASYDKGAEGMDEAGRDLENRTSSLMSQVTDLSVLGTYDTLGGVAQMIYGVFLEVFQETASDLGQGYGDTGEALSAAGKMYRETEQQAEEIAQNSTGGL